MCVVSKTFSSKINPIGSYFSSHRDDKLLIINLITAVYTTTDTFETIVTTHVKQPEMKYVKLHNHVGYTSDFICIGIKIYRMCQNHPPTSPMTNPSMTVYDGFKVINDLREF